jgi:hypothetical protein
MRGNYNRPRGLKFCAQRFSVVKGQAVPTFLTLSYSPPELSRVASRTSASPEDSLSDIRCARARADGATVRNPSVEIPRQIRIQTPRVHVLGALSSLVEGFAASCLDTPPVRVTNHGVGVPVWHPK